ncbi:hypothetical protein [Phaeobacter phage MD18]|nr:hypothetical protein [Phaeobacter phage MD18]
MPEILLCGAEGEQFLYENTLDLRGADDKRRGSVKVELGQQMFRQFSGSYSDFWVHFRVTCTETHHNRHSGILMEIRSGVEPIARLYSEAMDDTDYVDFRFDAADSGGYVEGPAFAHGLEDFVNYDIRVQTDGGTRTVSFYRNEVLRYQVSYAGVSGLPNAVQFNSRTNWVNEDETFYQDIIVTDGLPTVGMELATLVPSAVGSYSDFTNDYTAIDDAGYDQSTVISTASAGDRESWFFSDPEFNLGDKVIYGVAVTTVAQTDLLGTISDFEPFLRIDGTNYPAAQLGANNVAPNAYTVVYTSNPATTNPWQQEELVGLESGLRSV